MNVKTKSILTLIITLIIGIVIGSVGSGMVREYVIRSKISRFRSPQGFIERLERVIQPDSVQAIQLREKLEKQHQQVDSLSRQFRTDMDSLNSGFQKDLKDILNQEQQERLAKFFERMKRHDKDRDRRSNRRPDKPGGRK